jgi:hypothetical protein
MSDDNVAQPEENISRAEYENLQEQLKAARAERDRQIFEKSEIVAKANVYAKERDDLKESLASAAGERDRLAQEKSAIEASLRETTRRADEAAAEAARLRQALESAPSSDPAEVIWALASDKTRAAVAWVRGKIPADSPLLPYFDKTVETVTKLGCMAVKLSKEFIAWATPKAIELSKKGMTKVEEMLAKK